MQNLSQYAVCDLPGVDRARFIRRTYIHLALAVLAFIGFEFALLQTNLAEVMINAISGSRFAWLIFLGAFVIGAKLATGLATSSDSKPQQYMGLFLYSLFEAVIFLPMLYIATQKMGPEVLKSATLVTLGLFGGLTLIVFTTRSNFSFLGGIVKIGLLVALGAIISSVIFGFTLGTLFSVIMIALASSAILYDTSNILHHYREDQYVAASLSLFASVALLFWYVLRFFMSRD